MSRQLQAHPFQQIFPQLSSLPYYKTAETDCPPAAAA